MNPSLFLGYPLDAALEQALNRRLLSCFSGYLQTVSQGEQLYFGKEIPSLANLEELENLQAHVLSLLKKMAPSYPFGPCHVIATF